MAQIYICLLDIWYCNIAKLPSFLEASSYAKRARHSLFMEAFDAEMQQCRMQWRRWLLLPAFDMYCYQQCRNWLLLLPTYVAIAAAHCLKSHGYTRQFSPSFTQTASSALLIYIDIDTFHHIIIDKKASDRPVTLALGRQCFTILGSSGVTANARGCLRQRKPGSLAAIRCLFSIVSCEYRLVTPSKQREIDIIIPRSERGPSVYKWLHLPLQLPPAHAMKLQQGHFFLSVFDWLFHCHEPGTNNALYETYICNDFPWAWIDGRCLLYESYFMLRHLHHSGEKWAHAAHQAMPIGH